MKPHPILDAILALLALILALAAAYWLDRALVLLSRQASQTFDYWPILWAPALFQLLLAVGLVALVWWLATRAAYPRAIDVVYVLAGLGAVLLVPLTFTFRLTIPLYDITGSGAVSFWTVTGAVWTMAGLLHLFRRRPMA